MPLPGQRPLAVRPSLRRDICREEFLLEPRLQIAKENQFYYFSDTNNVLGLITVFVTVHDPE